MAMKRRALLLGAAAPAALAIGAAGPALAARREQPVRRFRGPPPRRLQLKHAHTGNRFSGPYHDGRTVDPIAMADLSVVLADSRTGAMRPFDPRAIDVLWEVGQKAGAAGEFLIFSGYAPATNNTAVPVTQSTTAAPKSGSASSSTAAAASTANGLKNPCAELRSSVW